MDLPLIQIYDTTLRDGTQSEGFTLSSNDKVRIAQKLDELGVAFIEGGWPGSNPKDVEFFERARDMQWKNALIAAFVPPAVAKADRKRMPTSKRCSIHRRPSAPSLARPGLCTLGKFCSPRSKIICASLNNPLHT